jgi:hypothetical protein
VEKETPPTGTDNATSWGEELIEIHDPELDPQTLMVEIRRRIQERRVQLGVDEQNFPRFGAATSYPEPPDDLPYSSELYFHLEQVNGLYAEVETAPVLAHSPATGLPVLGRLWKMIRNQAHTLILFYVNREQAHQVNVNRHLVSVLNELVLQNQEQMRKIVALEAELEK